jgi:hypothetical protein
MPRVVIMLAKALTVCCREIRSSAMCRLCELANVRTRAAQFLSLTGIFIALKPTLANRHYRHIRDAQ